MIRSYSLAGRLVVLLAVLKGIRNLVCCCRRTRESDESALDALKSARKCLQFKNWAGFNGKKGNNPVSLENLTSILSVGQNGEKVEQ